MRKVWFVGLLALILTAAPLAGPAAAGERGGILKVGMQPLSNLDPHFAVSITDIMLVEQLYHHLTFIDTKNKPEPDLAEKWESADGKVWVFTLRKGVKFNNGTEVTAKDVVYSFNRIVDPELGTPAATMFKGIANIEALDDHTVQFTLSEPNPEFPADTGDYHTCIIPDGAKEPGKEQVGSGPYIIAEYLPEDRIILKKNPHFDQKNDKGEMLPFIDEIHMIFSPDMGGQVEALRGGQLNFVGGLATEFGETVGKDPNCKLLTMNSNMHYAIHMRSDEGHPAADVRVRQALKLATNQDALIAAVRPGFAAAGNGFTPVGPAYGDYYLDKPPVTDLEKARKLLAEAGAEGLEITLTTQNLMDVVPIATVWKEQLAQIGVKVNIQVVPSDLYYGEGENSWLQCDFGITDWGARATPVTYFKLAYNSDGPWNESHWSDAEFDGLAKQVDTEMDYDKRVELYHKLQEIMIERGPIVVAFFEKALAGVSVNLEGVELAPDWARTRFWNAYFKK